MSVKTLVRGFVQSTLLIALILLFIACTVRKQDVEGLYLGIVQEVNGKPAEYFVELYSNGQFVLRKTNYEEVLRSISRSGSWSISGSIITLVTDGEKDIRVVYERSALRLEAQSIAQPELPFDQISLHKIGFN